MDELLSLHTQFYIDKAALLRRVEALLDKRSQVTLVDVLAQYPPEKGLAEVLAYCSLAADDPDSSIDAHQKDLIELRVATPDGLVENRIVSIPRVLYTRRNYAE